MLKKYPASRNKKDYSLPVTSAVFGLFLFFICAAAYLMANSKTHSAFCANSISCIKDLSGKKEPVTEGEFMGQKVMVRDTDVLVAADLKNMKAVLGDQAGDYKHIYVSLDKQKLYAYEGTTLKYDFSISSGKWNPTPTGDFRIWIWLRYTRMKGGNPAIGTYYNLPNVPYTMYFYNDSNPKEWGYSLHGAYWHNNFGHPMSHGCVNMRVEDAGKIFYWTNPTAKGSTYPTAENPGTLITIYGNTPKE